MRPGEMGYGVGMRAHRVLGLVLFACLLAGCGGGSASSSTHEARPRIAQKVAAELAAQADAIATSANVGDLCRAADEVRALQQAVDTAVANGQVPARLQQPLVRASASLGAQITCTPKPATPPAPPKPHPPRHDPHRHGHHHGHGHGNGNGNGQGDGGDGG
jgi:hypothetical protein